MGRICNKCGCKFPCSIVIDGKKRNISRRSLCLQCLPFLYKKPKRTESYRKNWQKEYEKLYYRRLIATREYKSCEFCSSLYRPTNKNQRFCSIICSSQNRKKYLDIPECLESAHRKLDKNIGYVRVYCPMHLEANNRGYVYEHRIIAEQMIGRSLLSNEIVHHKNGKRWDNRAVNLEVMYKKDHAKLHGQRPEDLII